MIKKTVLTVMAAIGLVTYTQGQGYVDFNNYAITNNLGNGAPIYDATNAPFNGVAVGSADFGDVTNFFAQLYAAAGTGVSSASLVPVGIPVNMDIPGYVQFDGDETTLSQGVVESVVVPTNSVGTTLQIRAWWGGGTQVTSFEQARVMHTMNTRFGVSPTLSLSQGGIGDNAEILPTELDNLQSFNLQVPAPCPTITVGPAFLGDGLTNHVYTSPAVTGSGGAAPYTFSVTSGSLPAGLTLDTNTGVVSGTPTAVGLSSFTITATDFNGCSATHNYAVQINATCAGGTPNVPKIVYPKNNGSENTNGAVLITGNVKASAGHVLQQILVSLNGGVAQGGTVAGTNWSYLATLTPGTNTVSAVAVDTCGNLSASSVNTTFQWAVTNLLTVNYVGSGSGVVKGKFVLGAFTAAPAGFPLLNIGQSYTIGFSANANNIFSNAVLNQGTNVLATVPSTGSHAFTFTMASNLTLTVAFETNGFLVAKGTYYGLFYQDPTNVQVASAGFIRVDTAGSAAGGTFSAQFYVQGSKVKAAGAFDLSGHGVVTTFAGPGAVLMASGSSLSLDLDLPGAVAGTNLTLTGTIINSTNWTSPLMADKQFWKKIVNPCPLIGKYTMILPGGQNGVAGDGFATIALASNGGGLVSAAGDYADLAPLSPITTIPSPNPLALLPAASTVSKELRYPFYTKIYATGTTYAGIGIGWLQFSTTNVSGNVIWIKPASVGGTYPNQPAGFTNEVAVLGSSYTAPALPAASYQLTLAGGNLASSIILPGNAFNGTSFTVPANANTIHLSLSATTGGFVTAANASSFAFPGHTTPPTKIYGAVLQNASEARGFFIGSTQTICGSVLLQ